MLPNNKHSHLEDHLYQALCRHQVIGTRFFVACSGGRDSLSLAFACVRLHQLGRISQLPTLIHIHHGLQTCADDWAKMVQAFANSYNLPIIIKYLQLDDCSEQGARIERYRAFFDCTNDGDYLLMAHHQDDQAETVLMRLVNGAGLQGLAAMAEFSQKFQNNQKLNILRPWLAISRTAISEYASIHQLPYVDDPTNLAGDGHINARAFIRSHLKDLLHQLNPKAYANIARTAQVLASDYKLVEACVSDVFYKRLAVISPWLIALDLRQFDTLSSSLQMALVRAFAKYEQTSSPSHRLSSDLLNLATNAHSNHQSVLFWQTFNKAYIFYYYKSIIYRYEYQFWQMLQADVVLDIQAWRGRFVYQDKTMAVVFDDEIVTWQKLGKSDKIKIDVHYYSGKKLYQRLAIPAHYRHNLWLLKTKKAQAVLGVGRIWLICGTLSAQFLKDNLVI